MDIDPMTDEHSRIARLEEQHKFLHETLSNLNHDNVRDHTRIEGKIDGISGYFTDIKGFMGGIRSILAVISFFITTVIGVILWIIERKT